MQDTRDIAPRLDALCAVLDEEAERQETLLCTVRAQGEAARMHDVDLLRERTDAVALLVRGTAVAEAQRIALLREVVAHFALPEELQTLSGLIAAVPAPWQERMRAFQQRMQHTLAETRRTVRANQALLRRGAETANKAVDALCEGPGNGRGVYDALGETASQPRQHPALLDRKG